MIGRIGGGDWELKKTERTVAGVRAGTDFATVAHPCLVALAFTGRCTGAMVVAVVQTGF